MNRRSALVLGAAAGVIALVTIVVEPSTAVTALTDVGRWALGPSVSPVAVERSVAAAANIALFVPLGAVLRWRGIGSVASVAGPAALSAAVEVAQWLWLPRDGEVADVVLNSVGALVGAGAVSLRSRRGRAPRSA